MEKIDLKRRSPTTENHHHHPGGTMGRVRPPELGLVAGAPKWGLPGGMWTIGWKTIWKEPEPQKRSWGCRRYTGNREEKHYGFPFLPSLNLLPELPIGQPTWSWKQGNLGIVVFLVAQTVKNLPAIWETWLWSLGWGDPLEKGTATHSSVLAWRIPWMEEPGGLQSMGSQDMTEHLILSLSCSTEDRRTEMTWEHTGSSQAEWWAMRMKDLPVLCV